MRVSGRIRLGVQTLVWFVVPVFVFNGCGSTAAGSSPPATGSQLSIGVALPISTLNPLTIGTDEELNLANFIWAGLIGINQSGYPFPMLSQKVPSYGNGGISRDGKTITFTLRPGLYWSDGKPLTAADVRFGWLVAKQKWADMCPAACWAVRNVTVSSTVTAVFHLSRPFAPLMFDLPPVLPRHQIWKGSWVATRSYLFRPTTTWLASSFAVDGAYRVQAATNSAVTLGRNPKWTLSAQPAYRSVVVRIYATDPALIAAAQSGAVQIAQGFNVTDIYKGIINPSGLGKLKLRLYPTGGLEHLELNVLKPPLDQLKVRQALNLAVDRTSLVKYSLKIDEEQARSLVAYAPEIPGRFDGISVSGVWDPIRGRFLVPSSANAAERMADAETLLSRAGWRLSGTKRFGSNCGAHKKTLCMLTTTMLIPKTYLERIREGQVLQGLVPFLPMEWGGPSPIGMHTILNFRQWSIGNLTAPYRENGPCARGWFDFCLFAQLPGYDPQTDFDLEFTSGHIARNRVKHGLKPRLTDLNYAGIEDGTLDSIFQRAQSTFNLARRRSLYRKWQAEVAKEAYWIPLYQQPFIVVERGTVRNFNPTPRGAEWNPWALAPG